MWEWKEPLMWFQINLLSMHWGHISKTEMIRSPVPDSWTNQSRNYNRIDLYWGFDMCSTYVHLYVHVHENMCVPKIKASSQDYRYLFQRVKKSNLSALRVPLGAGTQDVKHYKPPHSDSSYSAGKQCPFPWSITHRNRGRTRLPPHPVPIVLDDLSGKNTGKHESTEAARWETLV